MVKGNLLLKQFVLVTLGLKFRRRRRGEEEEEGEGDEAEERGVFKRNRYI